MEMIELYKRTFASCIRFAVYRKKEVISDVEKFMSLLHTFVFSFLTKNLYGLGQEDYEILKCVLLQILQDMVQALENRDTVLLEDTVEYGLKEFLELFFVDEHELNKLREDALHEYGNL